jgi:dTDP-4-dehydrorhamnose 3,5-epimerase
MKTLPTRLPGVVIVEPQVFADARGFFMETYHSQRFAALGVRQPFVQDNHSCSARGVLRGLHYQIENPQGKLLRVIRGQIFDVAVDMRRDSPHFGRSVHVILSDANRRQLYVPPGFAHGFCALTDGTEVVYKCTDFYSPQHERTLLWNDPALDIDWPIAEPLLSDKDRLGLPLAEADCYESCAVPPDATRPLMATLSQ